MMLSIAMHHKLKDMPTTHFVTNRNMCQSSKNHIIPKKLAEMKAVFSSFFANGGVFMDNVKSPHMDKRVCSVFGFF